MTTSASGESRKKNNISPHNQRVVYHVPLQYGFHVWDQGYTGITIELKAPIYVEAPNVLQCYDDSTHNRAQLKPIQLKNYAQYYT